MWLYLAFFGYLINFPARNAQNHKNQRHKGKEAVKCRKWKFSPIKAKYAKSFIQFLANYSFNFFTIRQFAPKKSMHLCEFTSDSRNKLMLSWIEIFLKARLIESRAQIAIFELIKVR